MPIIHELIKVVKSENRDMPAGDVLIGLHWTAVTSLGTGLAASSGDAPCCHSRDIDWVGSLHRHSAFELAELGLSPHPLEASVGMAAINSLIHIDTNDVSELNARELIVQRGQDKKVALIGHFPFCEAVKKTAATLWVLELEPGPGEYPASAAAELLPQADVIGLTASTLMNETFDDLYPLFPKQALVVMIGPSTPMHPLLFEYGIDVLAGSQVVSPQQVYRYVGQGATLHKVEGLRRLTLSRKTFLVD